MTSGHATSLQHFGRLLGGAARCSAAIATGARAGDMVFELRRLKWALESLTCQELPGFGYLYVFFVILCVHYIFVYIFVLQ